MRFHSWCREAAFDADELGFYFQVECASWANSSTTALGKGLPIDRWLYGGRPHPGHTAITVLRANVQNEPAGGSALSGRVGRTLQSTVPAVVQHASRLATVPRTSSTYGRSLIQAWGQGCSHIIFR
jgi:hypothetical protein